MGSLLLTKVDIMERCSFLVDERHNEMDYDRETDFVAFQRKNLGAKMTGIHEFNLVRNRIKQGIFNQQIVINLSDEDKAKVRKKIYENI